MKKTLIALLALSSMAVAGVTTTYDTFTWDTSGPYKDCTTVSDGTLTYTNGGWWVNGPTTTFETISLSQWDTLDFSFTFDFNSSNSILTMALAGENGAVVIGRTYNDNAVKLGTTTETGDAVLRGYAFGGTNNGGNVGNITDGIVTLSDKSFSVNTAETVNENTVLFSVAYSEQLSQFVGTLTFDGASTTINLGETFSVNAITATFDGAGSYVAHVKDVTLIHTTPEPATATLSLLALAGLAARRKRH